MAKRRTTQQAERERVAAAVGAAFDVLKAKHGTVGEVAKRLGVHENTLFRWKRGLSDIPSGMLLRLYELAGVSMDEAFGLRSQTGGAPGRAAPVEAESDRIIDRMLASVMRLSGGAPGSAHASVALPSANQIGRRQRARAIEVLTEYASADETARKGKRPGHEEWANDPSSFKQWFRKEFDEAWAARDAGDPSALHRCALDVLGAAPQCTDEPAASDYDRALIKLLNDETRARLSVVDFAGTVKCLERVRALFDSLAERQAALGGPPYPCSVEWQMMLLWLADAKWKGPKTIRDSVMLPLEMIERSEFVEERILRYLSENPTTPEDRAVHMQNNAWCAVKQLDMAARYCPGHLPVLKKRFNDRSDGLLDDRSMPFYWDFRIAQSWWEGTAGSSDLAMLFAKRRVALRKLEGPYSYLVDFDRSSDSELKYLKRHPAAKLRRAPSELSDTTRGR